VRDELAQDAQRLLDARQVGVGLVEAELLDDLEAFADDPPHALGGLLIGREVGRDQDRVGALAQRARRRHRGADAELPRLVGRCRDHRPRPVARHDHRLAAQLGPLDQLDRRVERVAVQMSDDALCHGQKVGPRTDVPFGG
jgi:hypothetical protein